MKTAEKPAAGKELNKRKILQGLAPAVSLLWLAWSFRLTELTFVSTKVIFFMMAGSGSITILVILLVRQRRKIRLWSASMILYFLIGTAMLYSIFAHINYYGPHTDIKTVSLPMLERGTKNIRHSSCRDTPYGVVVYNDIKREIRFKCEDKELSAKARMIALQVEKGPLGYYIYTKKDLIY
ncbi:hypothetical protein GFS24_20885 [Chitinophaga sp. SYP-B3965]|uniref:hypothetical protein n=1 Tax=Chitinophaga sp. SYP-B3965 TaxID=2663120 RepID=UPI001299B79C|nr:hypothetical protein [Chitinophaga sp. SYP-B3965]MRG47591.1 hypothetical protein [Chitinophaga sp. SYP-B3965]